MWRSDTRVLLLHYGTHSCFTPNLGAAHFLRLEQTRWEFQLELQTAEFARWTHPSAPQVLHTHPEVPPVPVNKVSGNISSHPTLHPWLWCHSCASHLGVRVATPTCLTGPTAPSLHASAPSRLWLIGEVQKREVPSGAEPPCTDADKNSSPRVEKALWGIRLSS